LGAEFYYEIVPGEIATGLKDSKSVAFNLMITFD
jgi:hypothetical protein